MYIPTHAREERPEVLHDAVAQIRFGSLITVSNGRPAASHIPMLLESRDDGDVLIGHLAKANPQWKDGAGYALATFIGPNFYVSPSLYETKAMTHKVVPTWDYIIVQAEGIVRFLDDPKQLLRIVERLTDAQEERRPQRWHVSDAPGDFIENKLLGIVGFELRIESLTGAWKLSRNRSAADRAGVANEAQNHPDARVRALEGLIRGDGP
jgi:transcriptional regulator